MRNFQLFHENLRIRFSHLVLKNILFDAKFRNDLVLFQVGRRKGSIQVGRAELGTTAEQPSEEGPMAAGVTECWI